MNNYILEYYQKINDGSITVCRWTKLAYQRIIEGLESKSFFYAPKKAQSAIVFIEGFIHHHEGSLAPQKLKLELWQKAMISCIFGIVDADGLRVANEVFIVIARKQGKTLLAAGVAAYCAYCDGEYGARVYFAAPKLDQANLAYDALYNSITQEELLDRMSAKRRTDIYVSESNTIIKPLAFNSKAADGYNLSCGVCDEIASWPGDKGLKYYEVLKSSQGARLQPLLIAMSSAGYVNEGIYDELFLRSTRCLLGDSKEQHLFPFIYQIEDPSKWNDINELQKSNPNLGVSVRHEFLLREITVAEGSLSKKVEFLTKYCNVKQSSSLAWLPAHIVEAASSDPINPENFREHYAVGGIDLSMTTDLTSCCMVIEKNGRFNVLSKFFIPSEKLEEATARDGLPYALYVKRGLLQLSGDNMIDYHDCFAWFAEMIERYHIYPLQIGYDRYSAQYLINDLKAYGCHCTDVFQGFNLTPVIHETEGLIRDGKINIGDNDLLKVHLLNTALKLDSDSQRCKIVKLSAKDHIDGCAALLCAMTARAHDYEQIGQQLKNER